MTAPLASKATTVDTYRALLGTVSKTANVFTRSIGMLDTFVTEASENQADKAKVARSEFRESLIIDNAKARAEADIEIQQFCKQSDDHQKCFTAAEARLRALFA